MCIINDVYFGEDMLSCKTCVWSICFIWI